MGYQARFIARETHNSDISATISNYQFFVIISKKIHVVQSVSAIDIRVINSDIPVSIYEDSDLTLLRHH